MKNAIEIAPAVIDISRQPDGLVVRLHDGQLYLRPYSERAIRVVFAPNTREQSSASTAITDAVLVGKGEGTHFEVVATEHVVGLSTSSVRVEVDRMSGKLRFLDPTGQVILSEPLIGGRGLTPVVVNAEPGFRPRQTFVSPPNEHIYGLGQHPEGTWNWRGMPVELKQLNTVLSLPMIVSTGGYGLLWNNASLTQFNPVNDEIAIDPETRAGTFTSTHAGEYVFMVRGGDQYHHLGIAVNDRVLVEVKNFWSPTSISGKIELPANTTVNVGVLGGGPTPRLYARPLGDVTAFESEIGDGIDYVFFYGPQLDAVIQSYRNVTGHAPLWPLWAHGFWQCRERYESQQHIVDIATEFRNRQIPVDLIIQDWQYWGPHGWGAYQWGLEAYPDPEKMIADLHALNFKYMISVWSNPEGKVHDSLEEAGGLIGETNWVDVYNPEARRIRWKYMNDVFFGIGTDAWWQDATEPSDQGDVLPGRSTSFGSGNRVRNAYPLFASQTAYEGQLSTKSEKRFVNLTRSAYPGQQRFATAAWSADIAGDWATLRKQIPAGLNFCAAGIPYWATDTGGFFRPQDQYASPDYNELLVRWFQWSTFTPILRIHGFQSETEIWKFPVAEAEVRRYLDLRYRMLPYNYSISWMVTNEGYTQMRALAFDFPEDRSAHGIGDEYMFGPAFLVCPVTSHEATSRAVYLPGHGEWVDFWTGATHLGGQTIQAAAPLSTMPLFVRAGSIVPLGTTRQYAGEKPADPIEIRVYSGVDAKFTLYEDEGDNYNHRHGAYTTIPFSWDEGSQTLSIGDRFGSFPDMVDRRQFNLVWVTEGYGTGISAAERPDVTVQYVGRRIDVKRP